MGLGNEVMASTLEGAHLILLNSMMQPRISTLSWRMRVLLGDSITRVKMCSVLSGSGADGANAGFANDLVWCSGSEVVDVVMQVLVAIEDRVDIALEAVSGPNNSEGNLEECVVGAVELESKVLLGLGVNVDVVISRAQVCGGEHRVLGEALQQFVEIWKEARLWVTEAVDV